MKDSPIEWTDHTFNPWIGCYKLSRGCQNCYAAHGILNRTGYGDCWGPKARRADLSEAYWEQPLRWNANARKRETRARVFSGSACDVFEDRDDLYRPRHRLFDLIDRTPHLDWLLLTKRPENMLRLAPWSNKRWPANVWALTSAEDQHTTAFRLNHLAMVPAVVRGLSAEPLLEPIVLDPAQAAAIDWLIIGGESGDKARPCMVEWIQALAGQARTLAIATYVKQLGSNAHRFDRPLDLAARRGQDPEEWPEDLRIREFPVLGDFETYAEGRIAHRYHERRRAEGRGAR